MSASSFSRLSFCLRPRASSFPIIPSSTPMSTTSISSICSTQQLSQNNQLSKAKVLKKKVTKEFDGVATLSTTAQHLDDDEAFLFPERPQKKTKKVIVIGAGFSGLSVAYHLKSLANAEVTILEGRSRVGGRVWPYTGLASSNGNNNGCKGTVDNFASEALQVTVDLGGQWIHEASPSNPIIKLMQQLDIPLLAYHRHYHSEDQQQTRYEYEDDYGAVFDEDGQLMNENTLAEAIDAYARATSLEDAKKRGVDINDATTSMQDLLNSHKLCDRSTKKWPASSLSSSSSTQFDRCINLLASRKEGFEGGRMHEISASLNEMHKTYGGQNEVAVGGYGAILRSLVKVIGAEKINLDCVVKSIKYSKDVRIDDFLRAEQGDRDCSAPVRVHLANGEIIDGDYCVCTLSIGVLQHRKVQFIPDLPLQRWMALGKIGMGVLDKVALRFPHKFWGGHVSFCIADSDPKKIKFFYDQWHVTREPILLLFHSGDGARRVDNDSHDVLSDEAYVQEVMTSLRKVFGSNVLDPISYKVTRWNIDPFSMGSYSYAKVGSTEADYDEISRPVGNLLFAGEATCKTSYGFVHGAWLSGEHAANSLRRVLTSSDDAIYETGS